MFIPQMSHQLAGPVDIFERQFYVAYTTNSLFTLDIVKIENWVLVVRPDG